MAGHDLYGIGLTALTRIVEGGLFIDQAIYEADKIINMYSPTITFAIMHRLSELARYSPDRLQHILDSQMGWVVSEFIKLAPYQFIDEISSEITGKEIMPPMIRS